LPYRNSYTGPANAHPSRYCNNATGACPQAEDVHEKSASWEAANFCPVSRNYPLFRRQCDTHFGALFTIPRRLFTVGVSQKQINSFFYYFFHIQTKDRQTDRQTLLFYLSAVFIVTIARFQAMWTHYVSMAPRCFSGRTKERLDASFRVNGTGPINFTATGA
jgi:hypothetical protein